MGVHGGPTEGALPSGAAAVAPEMAGEAPVTPDTAGDEAFPRRRWTAPGLRLARVTRVRLAGSARSAGPSAGDDALRHNRNDVTS